MRKAINHPHAYSIAILLILSLLTTSCKRQKPTTANDPYNTGKAVVKADSADNSTSADSRFEQRAKDLLPTDKLSNYYDFMARHEEMAKKSQALTTLVYFLEDDAMLHCTPSKLYEMEMAWYTVMEKVCKIYYEEKAESKNATDALAIAEFVSSDLENTFSYLASSTNSEMNLYSFIMKRMLMYRCLLTSQHQQHNVGKEAKAKLREELRQWVMLLAAIEEYVDKQNAIVYDGGSISASIYYAKCNEVLESRLKWCSTTDADKQKADISLTGSIAKLNTTLNSNMVACKTSDGATPAKTKALSKATNKLKRQLRTWQTACGDASHIGSHSYEQRMASFICDIDKALSVND